jgi:hypothetical protein
MARSVGSVSRIVRLVSGPFWSLALATLLLATVLTASLVYDRLDNYQLFSNLLPGHLNGAEAFLLVFCSGAFFGMFCSGLARAGWKETASCFWIPITRTWILIPAAAVLALSALLWETSAWVSDDHSKFKHLLQHDPGGLFAAFMGLVTIVGFAFTLHDLREMRRRITTFPDLIDRLTAMLSTRGSDDVRFLCYTPALGYIALEDNEFKKFYDAMRGTTAQNMPRLDMICLNKGDLADWHNLFQKRRTRRKRFENPDAGGNMARQKTSIPGLVDTTLAAAATKVSERIVTDLIQELDLVGEKESRLKRLPFEFLPGYYFFVSSNRAIVVAPLQLPFPKGAPRTPQLGKGTVQMLGFETNDRSIIHDLVEFYDSYKTLPSSYIAQCTAIMDAGQVEGWCQNQLKAANSQSPRFASSQAAVDEIFRQFRIAAGLGPDPHLPEEKTLREDYKAYIDPTNLAQTKLEILFRVSLWQE